MHRIKVLIVEDSLVFRKLLEEKLNMDPGIEVIATARDPYEARDAILKFRPDVMTLDVELPKMNGIEFMRKLMPQYPIPTVVISSLSDKVFDAMNAGAVDFVAKPQGMSRAQLEEFVSTELPGKIKIAAVAKVGNGKKKKIDTQNVPMAASPMAKQKIIAIGASTGGTEAIATVLKGFGPDIPGTVIVQHMPAGFTKMYADRLNETCRVAVKEAENGDKIVPGLVLLAPGGDQHMQVVAKESEYQVVLKKMDKVNGHRPSVDVLFHSVAESVGKNAIGIILTGMGGDGAKGLLAMKEAGAKTIGQDESTCVVYGMPKVAYELGGVLYQEKLEDIAKKTYQLFNK